MRAIVTLGLFVSAIGSARAQSRADLEPPAQGLFGQLTDSETHTPLHRAAVKVYDSKNQWDVITNGDGRFRFPSLTPGTYTLVAHRSGYTDRAYKIELPDFEKHRELPIALRQQGIVTGRVTDSNGMPLQGARIEAMIVRNTAGSPDVAESTETDDLGEYRLSGIDPGTYRIRCAYRGGRESEFDPTPLITATVLYGAAESPAEVAVKPGGTVAGVNFEINPTRPASVRGRLLSATSTPIDFARMWIQSTTGQDGHSDNGRDGKFQIRNVNSGIYTISAFAGKQEPLFGAATVQVRDSDVEGVEILLRRLPVIQVELRVRAETPPNTQEASSIFFTREQKDNGVDEIGHPDAQGHFSVGLVPGTHQVRVDTALAKVGDVRMEFGLSKTLLVLSTSKC